MGSGQSKRSRPSPTSKVFSKGTTSSSQSPPAYEEVVKILEKAVKRSIRGTDAPKYDWTNAECREWICAVLVEKCGRTEDYAREKGEKFDGCGPNLWLKEYQSWTVEMGLGDDGLAICPFLVKHYNTEMRPYGLCKFYEQIHKDRGWMKG